MSKRSKTLQTVLSGESDNSLSFEELRRVLRDLGFEERTPSGGSHYTFSHSDVAEILTIPRKTGHVKPVYVRKVRALIQKYNLGDDRAS